MICAWTETSSADDRLVADDELGLERQRPGDADALALAAGELVRVARGSARGQADQRRAARQPRSRRSPRPAPGRAIAGLGEDLRHGHARVERAIRVLEDDLDLRRTLGQRRSAAAAATRSRAVEARRARASARRGRRMARPSVDLAAAAISPTSAERLAPARPRS